MKMEDERIKRGQSSKKRWKLKHDTKGVLYNIQFDSIHARGEQT